MPRTALAIRRRMADWLVIATPDTRCRSVSVTSWASILAMTRLPASAAWMSDSSWLISTRSSAITSDRCSIAAASALSMLSVSIPTSRCVIVHFLSLSRKRVFVSIMTMCRRRSLCSFRWARSDASVVDRPEPDAPLSRTNPAGASSVADSSRGMRSSTSDGTACGITRSSTMYVERCFMSEARKRPTPATLHVSVRSRRCSIGGTSPGALSRRRVTKASMSSAEKMCAPTPASSPSMRARMTSPARTWTSVAPRCSASRNNSSSGDGASCGRMVGPGVSSAMSSVAHVVLMAHGCFFRRSRNVQLVTRRGISSSPSQRAPLWAPFQD